MARATMDAWMMRTSGRGSGGQVLDMHLKAWTSRGELFLKWELRRLLPAVGYIEKGRGSSVSFLIRDQLVSWRGRWDLFQLPETQAYGASRASGMQRVARGSMERGAAAALEPEAWFSTQGMLFVWCWWATYRRGGAKQHTMDTLAAFLKKTVTADDALSFVHAVVTPEEFELCTANADDAGHCICMRELQHDLFTVPADPYEALIRVLMRVQAQENCPTARALAARMVLQLSQKSRTTWRRGATPTSSVTRTSA